VQPGPDAIGIIAISHGCVGIAARACGLVALDASKVTEVIKDRPAWLQDCRRMEVLGALPTGNGGTIELLYTQVNISSFGFMHYYSGQGGKYRLSLQLCYNMVELILITVFQEI